MKKILIIILLSLTAMASATPFAKSSEPKGKLVLNNPQPTKQLFPMRLQAIDGKNISDRGQAVWLKPGQYELTFSSMIDHRATKGQLSRTPSGSDNLENKITVDVEEGKTYFMAYDASDRDRTNWKPVVYKIK